MGQLISLIDMVQKLSGLDENETIYVAEPWTELSKALVALEPTAGGLPIEASELGLTYFLEVSVAREFLEDWSSGSDAEPALREKVERLIQYAINDA